MLWVLGEILVIHKVSETHGPMEFEYTEHVPLCFPITGW